MERLKLVNVLKSTFLGSEFHTFTIRSLKMLLLSEMHIIFCATYIYDLEQKVALAYLAERILHCLNGRAQTEFYNTMPIQ